MIGFSGAAVLVAVVAVLCNVAEVRGQDRPPLAPIRDSLVLAEGDEISLRLPNVTIPVHYDVAFNTRIHAADFTFDGQVEIEILCVEATSTIILHNRLSVISKVQLKTGTVSTDIVGFSTDEDTEFLTIPLATPLVKDQMYTLSITFTGQHVQENTGWYRASYTNANGQEVWFATSHFEAPNARQAFPCYDEPDKKATFSIQITNNVNYHALSNMPIIEYVINGDGTATTRFNETAPMSTYLLAFVVSDFESNCKTDEKGREECVYARPNGMHLTQWGLDTAVKGLVELENMLNVEYSLPKMDQIAVSDKDFSAGAMENWGIVIYRESRLLIDDSGNYNYKEKVSIGTVIMHEFAHQWFGDLVSPKWWTYLWINEGFATLFEYYGTHKLYPDMRLTDLMVLKAMHNIMATDAGDNPRPMTHYVETKTNIRGLFDYVSYQKSGTVLRMMMLALGDEAFFGGLTYFLDEMAYKNAVAEDLFAGLQKGADEFAALPEGLDVETIMNSWSLQGGYPLITASRDSETKVILKQNKFKVNDPATPASDFYIPITFTEGSRIDFNSPTTNNWFRGDAVQHEITLNAQSKWYILNKQQSSYYRVNYDDNNWRQLAIALSDEKNFKNIHLLNRAQLLDDSLDLAINGRLNVTIAFDIFAYLENEVDYIPWAAAENGLRNYYNKLKVSDRAAEFNEILANMTSKMYETYGVWAQPDDVYFTHLARNFAIRWACEVGLEACNTDASDVMAQHFHNRLVLDENYSDIIACAGFRTMNETDYNLVMAQVDGTGLGVATRPQALATALCTYNPEFIWDLLNRFIEADSLWTEAERVQILTTFVRRDIQSLEITVEFMKTNSDLLKAIITIADITTIFKAMATASYSESLATPIRELARQYENSLGNEVIAEVEALLAKNLAWMSETGEVVVNYLQEGNPVEEPEPDSATSVVLSSVLIMCAAFVAILNL